jgi:hypothetical protein
VREGRLGGAALGTRPEGGGSVDLIYAFDDFLYWQGLMGSDRTDAFLVRLRVFPTSRNQIARLGHTVLVSAESGRHQVVAAVSGNGGRNWEPAIALAKDADQPRRPDIDAAFGRFWVAYASGDTTLAVRSATDPVRPGHWSRGIYLHAVECIGDPSIVALPGDRAGLLFATPGGKVYFQLIANPPGPSDSEPA